ncbi:Arv1-like family-domain-containing protein [Lipomyces arxii]|uniref:Arv1-like family-domain-containing protein n=1 Tax=Lipomyces arxii TaxID=56418 RepID=UPI0034CE633C
MICIECAHPVTSLYTAYSSNNIRLTACPNCNKFADKYIEHDSVLIFIDLVLIKPQVYRHLAFNRLSISPHLHSTIRRIFVLITLFDVYLTWARAEKESYRDESAGSQLEREVLQFPVLGQYIFFVLYCLTETAVTHGVLRYFSRYAASKSPEAPSYDPDTVTIALLISSATKLFPILMVIWSYDIPAAAKAVGWAVNVSTIEALNIVLMCGHGKACGLMLLAVASRRATVRFFIWLLIGRSGLGMIRDEWHAIRHIFS